MAKVVITKFKHSTARDIGAKNAAVETKKVRGESGDIHTLSTLDAHSRSFTDDLTYVFGRNVARARRENKRLTGSADRVPRVD
jgi:hypothetical protein